MTQYETTIDGAWSEGKLTVRPGESIRFVGSVTGVTLRDDYDEVYDHELFRLAKQAEKRGLGGLYKDLS